MKAVYTDVHLCRFSALDDLPRRLRSDELEVLRVLAHTGHFSGFEVDGRLAVALAWIERNGWAKIEDGGYPWSRVTLTDIGRAALGG